MIPPGDACPIYIRGDIIHIDVGHHLQLHVSQFGTIIGILRARERAHTRERTVGTPAAPVQYDVDALDRKSNAVAAERKAAAAERKRLKDDEATRARRLLETLGL